MEVHQGSLFDDEPYRTGWPKEDTPALQAARARVRALQTARIDAHNAARALRDAQTSRQFRDRRSP